MLKKIRKKIQSQEGFTLLEILVVLTIMGFLIAMVAPRLASVGDDASETVCNTNKGRYRTYVSTFCNQNGGRFPDKLTNMVITEGSTAAYVAPASDMDPSTGKEVLNKGHNMMYKFMVHTLSDAEAGELNGLGISKVYNLNDYTGLDYPGRDNLTNFNKTDYPLDIDTGDRNPYMDEMAIEGGARVLMAGCGANDSGTFSTVGNTSSATAPTAQREKQWAYRDLFARIIFSIGPESELVTSGIISNAAHCPGSIVQSDDFTYGEYYLILPRLNATIKRLDGATITGMPASVDLTKVTAIATSKDDMPGPSYNIDANPKNYRKETVNLLAEQEPWQFETSRQRYDPVWHFDFGGNDHIGTD